MMLGEFWAQIFTTLIDDGWELPFTIAFLGRNGEGGMARVVKNVVEDNLDMIELAEYSPSANVVLPIHVMVVDRRGEAAHAVIEQDGTVRYPSRN